MTKLTDQKCVPCESDLPPLTDSDIDLFLQEVPEWDVVIVDSISRLKRRFEFKDFAEALEFTNTIGQIAEEEGHHPVIQLTWGEATVEWWTHNIKGLHQNDFIMAAKTSKAYQR